MAYYLRKMQEKVRPVLYDGEKVMLMFRQSLLNNISPTFIIATSQRLIIINNSFWGLYTGANMLTPTDYNYILYNKATGVVLVKGRLFASLDIRLLGGFETNMSMQKRTEGEIDGLRFNSAVTLMQFIEEQIRKVDAPKGRNEDAPQLYKAGRFRK